MNVTTGLLCLLCLLVGLVAGIGVRVFKDDWDRLGMEAKVRKLEASLAEALTDAAHWKAAFDEAINHASHTLTNWMDFKARHSDSSEEDMHG